MKILFRVICFLLFLVLVFAAGYYYFYNEESFENVKPIILICMSILAFIALILRIITNWGKTIKLFLENEKSDTSDFSKPFNYIEGISKFINRKEELKKLFKAINKNKVVNVFGNKGSGKSEFLKFVCDLTNGYHRREVKKKYSITEHKTKIKFCYYSDLSEVAGIDNIFAQISEEAFGEKCTNPNSLAHLVNNRFGKKKGLLIFDNISSLQAGAQLLEKICEYQRIRKQDKIIIGSVEKILDISKTIEFLEIKSLNDEAIREYFAGKNVNMTNIDIEKVKERTKGLPLYLNLLIVQLQNDDELTLHLSIENYLSNYILKTLPEGAGKLLIFLSYFNLTSTTIKNDFIINIPLTDKDVNLDLLRRYSTIIDIPSEQGYQIKVHDLIRDVVIKQSSSDQGAVNEFLYNYYLRIKDKHRAILHWILTDIVPDSYDDIISFLEQQIEIENYPYQVAIWDMYTRSREDSSIYGNSELQQIILYGYVKALLGSGDYKSGELLLNSSQFGSAFLPDLRNITKEIELEYHLAIVDIDHLLGRYQQAYDMTDILLSIAIENNFRQKEIKCKWFLAHLIGHMGNSLNQAIELYKDCVEKSIDSNDLNILKCKNGIYAIQAATNTYPENYEQEITATIKDTYTIEGTEAIRSSLLRNKARYLRRTGQFQLAKEAIDESLNIARSKRLRTIYNCHLAYGDLERFQKRFENSIDNYKTVIDFTDVNGDESLKASAIGGIIISEVCSNKLLYHNNWKDVNDEVIKWIDKSEEIGLEVIKLRFNIINSFLNGECLDKEKSQMLINDATNLHLNYEKIVLSHNSPELLHTMEMHIH